MPKRPTALLAAAALACALAGPPAHAQDGEDKSGNPSEMAREGIEQLMNAIETFVHSLPMYGAPRIDEEGNIVIPRLDKSEDAPDRAPDRKPRAPDGADEGPKNI